MSTNKTRVWFSEASGSFGPFVGVSEFDVYDEAVQYVEAIVKNTRNIFGGSAYNIVAFIFSYSNNSYYITWDGTTFVKQEITFPVVFP